MASVPFDQLDGETWFNGEFVPWKDAKIHVLTHGLHYASAVFEGERAYGGRVFKLTEHNQRLHASADLHGPSKKLLENIVDGAPPMAPLLFPNLALLGCMALWVYWRNVRVESA